MLAVFFLDPWQDLYEVKLPRVLDHSVHKENIYIKLTGNAMNPDTARLRWEKKKFYIHTNTAREGGTNDNHNRITDHVHIGRRGPLCITDCCGSLVMLRAKYGEKKACF